MNQYMQRQVQSHEQLIHNFMRKILKPTAQGRRIPEDLIAKLCEYLYVSPYRKFLLYLPILRSSYQISCALSSKEEQIMKRLLVESGTKVYLLEIVNLWKGIKKQKKFIPRYLSFFAEFLSDLKNKNVELYCSQENRCILTYLLEAKQRSSLGFQDKILAVMTLNYLVLTHQSKSLLFLDDGSHQIVGTNISVAYKNTKRCWQISSRQGKIWKRPKYINRMKTIVRTEPSSILSINNIFEIQGPFFSLVQ